MPVVSVGKIKDIFANRGLTDAVYTVNNMDDVDKTLEMMQSYQAGFLFTNLVDYDMKFGHRRDPKGYAEALEAFDLRLPEIMERLGSEDILILTADHGCDPTHTGTDHTREYVPMLFHGTCIAPEVGLGIRETFADIGATVADLLGCGLPASGVSMKSLICKPTGGKT